MPETGSLPTIAEVQANPKVVALLDGANAVMRAMGYTEHGRRHAKIVSDSAGEVLEKLRVADREVELGRIAAYLHDIGNVINRIDHPISGANLAYSILNEMGFPTSEIAKILSAIGNHEELAGVPVSTISAAVILADKSDVHYTRVQNPILESYDIHDRVNSAVQRSRLSMSPKDQTIELALEIDTALATVMEYFEIFLSRMVMCRKAAATFGYRFSLNVNGVALE
ncbi:MAG: HD domain-containing protein [Fimbriimonadaceae bacterium]